MCAFPFVACLSVCFPVYSSAMKLWIKFPRGCMVALVRNQSRKEKGEDEMWDIRRQMAFIQCWVRVKQRVHIHVGARGPRSGRRRPRRAGARCKAVRGGKESKHRWLPKEPYTQETAGLYDGIDNHSWSAALEAAVFPLTHTHQYSWLSELTLRFLTLIRTARRSARYP